MKGRADRVVLCTRLFDAGVEYLQDRVELVWRVNQEPRDILDDLRKASGVVVGLQTMDGETIRRCPNLRVIAKQGVGFDNVDAAAANEMGIPIVITPNANTRSVAEHTLCCILAAAKNLRHELQLAQAGDFSRRNQCEAYDLEGKTLGLLGFGKIGRMVAEMCGAFGMRVAVYDPLLPPDCVENTGCRYVPTLDELLRESDVVSIHVPLTKSTQGLISARELALMKSSACLVNCARGRIVDERALYEALRDKRIFCAALDTFEREPLDPSNPLYALDNVILTPHVAANTKEASVRMGLMVGEGVAAVLAGERCLKIGNPEVYRHPRWQSSGGSPAI